MIKIRKADYYVQIYMAILAVIQSIPFLFIHSLPDGILLLNCWQILSASLNTSAMVRSGNKKKILIYWILAVIDLLLYLPCLIPSLFPPVDTLIAGVIASVFSVIITFYYIMIYKNLIDHIEFKNELGGFLKS